MSQTKCRCGVCVHMFMCAYVLILADIVDGSSDGEYVLLLNTSGSHKSGAKLTFSLIDF